MSDNRQSILVVEDEATLRETLAYNLKREGYEVVSTGDGGAALELARDQAFDLIVLDVMLPTLDGLSIVRILRKEQRTPFSLGELLARVRAVLRRAAHETATRLDAGDLSLDLVGRKAYRGGQELR